MNLATTCFMVAKHPECYQRLGQEIMEAKPTEPELQSLPFIAGRRPRRLEVEHGKSVALAKTCASGRLGIQRGTYLPEGTAVSCTPYELHLDPSVFEHPLEFKLERWQNATEKDGSGRNSVLDEARDSALRGNLATMELDCAVQRLVEEDVLTRARCCGDRIEILECFNSKVVGEKMALQWELLPPPPGAAGSSTPAAQPILRYPKIKQQDSSCFAPRA